MRLSQSFFCSGVAPTVIGSLPRNVANKEVAMPKIDARHLFADAIDIEGASAHAAVLFGDEQELNAQFVRVAHVAGRSRPGIRRARPARSVLRQAAVSCRNPAAISSSVSVFSW